MTKPSQPMARSVAASAAKIQSIGNIDGAGSLPDQATHAATRAHGPRSK